MKLSTQILLAFSIVLVLSIIDTAANYLLSVKVEQNSEFLNKSQEIIRNSGRLHKSMIDMQSSIRGYLLTQDTAFLEGYEAGLKNVPLLIRDQRILVNDNNQQLSMLDSISVMHQQWLVYANALITARKNNTRDDYNDLFENSFKKQIGKKINDSIAQQFSLFDKIEYKTRDSHRSVLMASIRKTHIFSFIFFVLTIVVGILSTVYIISLISKRIKTMVRFAENISVGKFNVIGDHKNDELSSLSISLNTMSKNLRKNISELENRNAELDKFAYVVSHDLKAPVRGIHNVVTWIEEDHEKELTAPVKKYIDIILQRTKRMEDLINGLLEYARIRKKNDPETTDVGKLVNDIIETIVPRNVQVSAGKLPVIVTDRLKLEQVFMNLISNAVKYSPQTRAKIIIDSVRYSDYFEFTVKDNGIGIAQEYHNKIFEMFQTLREKGEKESTGIGLAVIKKILDDQHGTIRIESEPGKGSAFIFTWPIKGE